MQMRRKILLAAVAMVCLVMAAVAQRGGPRETAEVTIKGKRIAITYGRPSLQGRDMLGQATVGTVWRVGSNQATEIETAAALKVGSATVPAGKYSLWMKKTGDAAWVLAFHPKTGVWGRPELKDGYVAELPLTMSTAANAAEMLTITLADNKGMANVKIQWGTAVFSGDLGVN